MTTDVTTAEHPTYLSEPTSVPGLLLVADTSRPQVWAVAAACQPTEPMGGHDRAHYPREIAEQLAVDLGEAAVDWTAPWADIEAQTLADGGPVAAAFRKVPHLAGPPMGAFCEPHWSWRCGKPYGGCQVFVPDDAPVTVDYYGYTYTVRPADSGGVYQVWLGGELHDAFELTAAEEPTRAVLVRKAYAALDSDA